MKPINLHREFSQIAQALGLMTDMKLTTISGFFTQGVLSGELKYSICVTQYQCILKTIYVCQRDFKSRLEEDLRNV